MIAVDSCVVIDFLQDRDLPQVSTLVTYLASSSALLAPITVTELLSAPNAQTSLHDILPNFMLLELTEGYWERTGTLRAKIRKAGRKAALGDALIAQACIDNDVPLLTRDADFSAFVKIGGLKLA